MTGTAVTLWPEDDEERGGPHGGRGLLPSPLVLGRPRVSGTSDPRCRRTLRRRSTSRDRRPTSSTPSDRRTGASAPWGGCFYQGPTLVRRNAHRLTTTPPQPLASPLPHTFTRTSQFPSSTKLRRLNFTRFISDTNGSGPS